MQLDCNFTVGGLLSVNCHGRYVGLGPLILGAPDPHCAGRRQPCHRLTGGVAGAVLRRHRRLRRAGGHRRGQRLELAETGPSKKNPCCCRCGIIAATFASTSKATTQPYFITPTSVHRIVSLAPSPGLRRTCPSPCRTVMYRRQSYWFSRMLLADLITERPWGAFYRQLADRVLHSSHHVVWRNYEASYDVQARARVAGSQHVRASGVFRRADSALSRWDGGWSRSCGAIASKY